MILTGQPADYFNRLGASWAYLATANSVQTMLAAGSNVNGLVLRWAYIIPQGVLNARLVLDTSAPANSADTSKRILISTWGSASIDNPVFLPHPMFVPAGIGIYLACDAAAGFAGAGWDLR